MRKSLMLLAVMAPLRCTSQCGSPGHDPGETESAGVGGDGAGGSAGAPATATPTAPHADEDGDGVRDDIEEYIESTYPASARTRAALTQYAKAAFAFLGAANDPDAARQLAAKEIRAAGCLWYVRPGDADPVWGELFVRMLDTNEASRAYLKAMSHLGGAYFKGVLPAEAAKQCDFDPDSLED